MVHYYQILLNRYRYKGGARWKGKLHDWIDVVVISTYMLKISWCAASHVNKKLHKIDNKPRFLFFLNNEYIYFCIIYIWLLQLDMTCRDCEKKGHTSKSYYKCEFYQEASFNDGILHSALFS